MVKQHIDYYGPVSGGTKAHVLPDRVGAGHNRNFPDVGDIAKRKKEKLQLRKKKQREKVHIRKKKLKERQKLKKMKEREIKEKKRLKEEVKKMKLKKKERQRMIKLRAVEHKQKEVLKKEQREKADWARLTIPELNTYIFDITGQKAMGDKSQKIEELIGLVSDGKVSVKLMKLISKNIRLKGAFFSLAKVQLQQKLMDLPYTPIPRKDRHRKHYIRRNSKGSGQEDEYSTEEALVRWG